MKVKISYFYQIRNFTKYQIPLSVAMYDPRWFHSENGSTYADKNGVVNGLRFYPFIPHPDVPVTCSKSCRDNPSKCRYMLDYYKWISKSKFNDLMSMIEQICKACVLDRYYSGDTLDKYEAVLIVYETPDNMCSERWMLKKLFKENGLELEEWTNDNNIINVNNGNSNNSSSSDA